MLNLPLLLELDRWRRAGRSARLWWRDDDAACGSAALDRLLQASRAAHVPLTLAVVPSGDMTSLSARLTRACLVTPIQHGVDHQNRRDGREAGEFPHAWTRAELETVLREGWSQIQNLPRAQAIFAPPWNDVHPQLEAALSACGYAGWSGGGGLGAGERLARADVHLDLMRWRGGARFRGEGRLLRALTAELARRREAGLWAAPIGLLSHHLDHDERAWRFLESFLLWSATRAEFTWTALPDLISASGSPRAASFQPDVRQRRSSPARSGSWGPAMTTSAAAR